jgi:hypothetical protein
VAARLARIEARLAYSPEPVVGDRLRSYERMVVHRPPDAPTASAYPGDAAAPQPARARGPRVRKWAVMVLWLGLAWNLATNRTALWMERAVETHGQQLSAAICDASAAAKP